MVEKRVVVGIDVGKEFVEVARLGASETSTVARTRDALVSLAEELREAQVDLVAMEASGGYERLVLETLHVAGLTVALVQPQRVRAFAKAMGRRAKTDAIDAAVIASFAATVDLEAWIPDDKRLEEAKELMRLRDDLVHINASLKNRLKGPTIDAARGVLVEIIEGHRQQIAQLERRVSALLKETEQQQTLDRLQTVPGVGPIIATVLVTELPELGTFDRRTIAAFVGLAPMNSDSGKYSGKRVIVGGRAHARAALYQGANVAKIHNPVIKAFYARLRAKGKPHLVAMIAAARKLLTILDAMVRHGRDWNPAVA